MIELYKIVQGNTNRATITSHTRQITFMGDTYVPTPVKRSKIISRPNLMQNTVTLQFSVHTSLGLELLAQVNNNLANRLIVFRGEDENSLTQIWAGSLIQQNCSGEMVNVVYGGGGISLRQLGDRRPFQRRCPFILYDDLTCRASPQIASASVSAINPTRDVLLATGLGGYEVGYFTGGVLCPSSVYSRDNVGNKFISSHNKSGASDQLRINTPVELARGDSISVLAGCDRTWQTCHSKFDNIINFGGFPYLPLEDPYVAEVCSDDGVTAPEMEAPVGPSPPENGNGDMNGDGNGNGNGNGNGMPMPPAEQPEFLTNGAPPIEIPDGQYFIFATVEASSLGPQNNVLSVVGNGGTHSYRIGGYFDRPDERLTVGEWTATMLGSLWRPFNLKYTEVAMAIAEERAEELAAITNPVSRGLQLQAFVRQRFFAAISVVAMYAHTDTRRYTLQAIARGVNPSFLPFDTGLPSIFRMVDIAYQQSQAYYDQTLPAYASTPRVIGIIVARNDPSALRVSRAQAQRISSLGTTTLFSFANANNDSSTTRLAGLASRTVQPTIGASGKRNKLFMLGQVL